MQGTSDIKPLIDSIAVPVMVIDVEEDRRYRHRCVNTAAESYYSITNQDYACSYLDVLETNDQTRLLQRRRAIAAYNRCVERGEKVEFQFHYRMPNGERT